MSTTALSGVLSTSRERIAVTGTGVCRLCGQVVPFDEAAVPETMDYLMFFCGLTCYEQWRISALVALGQTAAEAP